MRVMVTGAAGFIGYHLAKRLLQEGHEVLGVDNLSEYYNVTLKLDRLNQLQVFERFSFQHIDISDRSGLDRAFTSGTWDIVFNLAAQAGVRYSISNPEAYVNSNLVGFANVLECCRQANVPHLVFASSSSVYGDDSTPPFREERASDNPVSFYAATKRANEMMAASYSHLYNMQITGLRFFTVYGPWGRPDMAYYTFVDSILNGHPIQLFNNGNSERDYTYIDDVVEAIIRLAARQTAEPEPLYQIFNVGGHRPVSLMEFVYIISKSLDVEATIELSEAQPGDVEKTCADTSRLQAAIGFAPSITLQEGIDKFVHWFADYHSKDFRLELPHPDRVLKA